MPDRQAGLPSLEAVPAILIDIPADTAHGELTCNIAMQLSRVLKKNPMVIAGEILPKIQENLSKSSLKDTFLKIEVKNPGFINFYFSPKGFYQILEAVLEKKDKYGVSNYGEQTPFCLEFVSANPTGPLTVAHGRQAAVGDSLVNILNAVGFKAKKEYYVNDEGNQIRILGVSVRIRAQEMFAKRDIPEEMYQGEYIKDIAKLFIKDFKINKEDDLIHIEDKKFQQYAVDYLMALIKQDLKDFNVNFDVWSYQGKIATATAIEEVLKDFQAKGYIYENEGAL